MIYGIYVICHYENDAPEPEGVVLFDRPPKIGDRKILCDGKTWEVFEVNENGSCDMKIVPQKQEKQTMKLNDRLEDIFAHAVALQQAGKLRSTIYCIGRKVYILNQDDTVIMRFRLRKVDQHRGDLLEFEQPVSFHANDYDSKHVEYKDGKICFIQESEGERGFIRTKSCRTPAMTPEEVEELFKSYPVEITNTVQLHSKMLGLLDENLSHIEFSAQNGEFKIVQRNVYSGSVIEIKRKEGKGGFYENKDDLEDFEPMGLRTNDFMALFNFVDNLQFHFLSEGFICVDSHDKKTPMRAIISKCVYDELGTTK